MRTPTQYLIEQRDRLAQQAARERQHEQTLAEALAEARLKAETAEAEAKAMTALINMLLSGENHD